MKKLVIVLFMAFSLEASSDEYWDNHFMSEFYIEVGAYAQISESYNVADFILGVHNSMRGHAYNVLYVHTSDPARSTNTKLEVNEAGRTRDTFGIEYVYTVSVYDGKKWEIGYLFGAGIHKELGNKEHDNYIDAKTGFVFRKARHQWNIQYVFADDLIANNLDTRKINGVGFSYRFYTGDE